MLGKPHFNAVAVAVAVAAVLSSAWAAPLQGTTGAGYVPRQHGMPRLRRTLTQTGHTTLHHTTPRTFKTP